MRLDHLLSKDKTEREFTNLRSVHLSYVLHCLVLRAHRRDESLCGSPYCSLKTAQKKQENLKGRFHVLMHEVFLTEVFYRKVESNRIDFPEESLMK